MDKLVNYENINRFNGFTELYNSSRPSPPKIIADIAIKYLGNDVDTVADIGSGTGLSTQLWEGVAKKIIGIEPNDDMRLEAEKNNIFDNISFQSGFSNDTKLPNESIDIVAISQAFHWMDIESTLNEVYRILKHDGLFIVFDCDWPPTFDWVIEMEFNKLHKKSDEICLAEKISAKSNDKTTYVERFNEFGKFRFVKEIVCHSVEKCNTDRMRGIALSQGRIQNPLKLNIDFKKDVNAFCDLVVERCKGDFEIIFSYRVRLCVK